MTEVIENERIEEIVAEEVLKPVATYWTLSDADADVYLKDLLSLGIRNAEEAKGVWDLVKRQDHRYKPKPHDFEKALVAYRTAKKRENINFDVLNFGEPSNGMVCDCGKHHGIGSWSPERRAREYAWYRHHNINYNRSKQDYLDSYESAHGEVTP